MHSDRAADDVGGQRGARRHEPRLGLADREVWLGVLVIAGWNVLMFAIAATRLRTQK